MLTKQELLAEIDGCRYRIAQCKRRGWFDDGLDQANIARYQSALKALALTKSVDDAFDEMLSDVVDEEFDEMILDSKLEAALR